MRINRFVALATGMGRRSADKIIESGEVSINGQPATAGAQVTEQDAISLNGSTLTLPNETTTLLFNKPVGYICSRDGQGGKTIYDLLPPDLTNLKPVGRLDKDSSGLLILTDDGALAYQLTHPSFQKTKIYEVKLDQPLQPLHRQMIAEQGIQLDDGPSKLGLERINDGDDQAWHVIMHEGRNRQVRRTFSALGYEVIKLHRIQFGQYVIGDLKPGETKQAS